VVFGDAVGVDGDLGFEVLDALAKVSDSAENVGSNSIVVGFNFGDDIVFEASSRSLDFSAEVFADRVSRSLDFSAEVFFDTFFGLV